MCDRRLFLKVKIKSLAAEAAIIRSEERRFKPLRAALADHRRGIVRTAARNTLLAYGFLRGLDYHQMERRCEQPPNWKEVERMVGQYGIPQWRDGIDLRAQHAEQGERLKKWIEGAKCAQE